MARLPASVAFVAFVATLAANALAVPTLGSFPTRPAESSYEPLGPSSRRTGIVLSEIQRHPIPRGDGRRVPFVELYNSNPFFEDLSGWRLSGDFDFTFPSNTVLAGQSFLVVAPSPDDLRADGTAQVIGGFPSPTGGPGFVRLRKRSGAIVLEVPLAETPAWPAAAFGSGHSLVLARPSFGEANPHAWAASSQIGGSPGRPDPLPSNPLDSVVLNEFLAHADPSDPTRSTDFVELLNRSHVAVDLTGVILREETSGLELRLPAGSRLGPGERASFSDPTFDLPAQGGRLAILGTDPSRVVDAARYGAQARGVPRGRYPDGAPEWYPLTRPTPALTNAPPTHPSVVINEIFYHPPDDHEEAEFIELFNPTDAPVVLGAWRFTDGVEFEFPPGASIPARGYVVVTANATEFRARHPHLDPGLVFGDWRGSLADGGERIVLAQPDGVDVDEVTYGDGGRWGRWSDGGGSSLERLDPRADGRLAPNWRDSDETQRAPWTTIETTGVLSLAHPGVPRADQLQAMLLGPGEALLDNVEVLVNGANRVANGSFEGGVSGWATPNPGV